MADSTDPGGAPPSKDLVLDDLGAKFEAFQAFRKSDTGAADAILDTLGAQDDVDRDIVLELSSPRPLGHPDRFPQAHALAVRALEVLDRNGARSVRVRGLGPLDPIAAFGVQQVAHFIVRSHQARVSDAMLDLYSRREANAEREDPSRFMLMRARMEMERLSPRFKRNALGAVSFLLGGAVLSTLVGFIQQALAAALDNLVGQIAVTVALGLIMAGVAWIFVRGAAVARRRINLTLDGPTQALWQTIGRCGDPPSDPSRLFALIGIVLAFLPWVLIPTGVLISWITTLF